MEPVQSIVTGAVKQGTYVPLWGKTLHACIFSLMEACYHGNMDCAKALVVGGASWLTTDNSGACYEQCGGFEAAPFVAGMSALHWAVDGGHIDMITYILDQGVPVKRA